MNDDPHGLEPVEQFLEGNLTTVQDEAPHKDGLCGNVYEAELDPNQLGKRGTNILNNPLNDPAQPDGDHYDIIEQDPQTENTYHNRVYDPIDNTGLDTGFEHDLGPDLDGGFGSGL